MTLAGDERMLGLRFLRCWSLMRAFSVCIMVAVATSVRSAEPDVNRVREHFKSDHYTVKWGTARTFDSLGESNQQQLSALLPNTYEDLDMPGGANSDASSDDFGPILESPETCTGNSLLDAIRVLTDMPQDERAALIELLKTWG